MVQQKPPLQELQERATRKRNNPDKREQQRNLQPVKYYPHNSNKDPNAYDANPRDVGPNTSVPSGKNPDKPAK